MTQTQILQLLFVMAVYFALGSYAVVRGRQEREDERHLRDEHEKPSAAGLVVR
jgi:hypothetical protein